jgi:hypothetical protein
VRGSGCDGCILVVCNYYGCGFGFCGGIGHRPDVVNGHNNFLTLITAICNGGNIVDYDDRGRNITTIVGMVHGCVGAVAVGCILRKDHGHDVLLLLSVDEHP